MYSVYMYPLVTYIMWYIVIHVVFNAVNVLFYFKIHCNLNDMLLLKLPVQPATELSQPGGGSFSS